MYLLVYQYVTALMKAQKAKVKGKTVSRTRVVKKPVAAVKRK